MQSLQSVQMPIIKRKNLLYSPLTALPNQHLMLHRHRRINILRIKRANNHFLIVLHRLGIIIYIIMLGDWKSIAMKLVYPLLWQQFSTLRKFMIQMNFPLTLKAKMMKVFHSFRILQRSPPSWKIFLEHFLPVQSSTGHLKCAITLNFVFVHVQFIPDHGGEKRIFIHHDHECKIGSMTPQELLKHLKNEGDNTHTAIFIYLKTLNTFSQGHARQNPSVNSKKKPDQRKRKRRKRRRTRRRRRRKQLQH
jgi:hypothetical protein